MNKKTYTLIGIFVLAFLAACTPVAETNPDTMSIATTFYPLYEATEMVARDSAEVFSIVPFGAEPHSFEPTPQDIIRLNQANAFVTLGIEFEAFEEELEDAAASTVVVIPAGKNIELLEFEDDHHEDEHIHPHDENDGEHDEEHMHPHEDDDDQEPIPIDRVEYEEEHTHDDDEEHADEEHAHDDEGEHEEEHHEEHADEEGHHHHHEGADPHIWLSPNNMKVMVTNIKNELVTLDPQNKAGYEENAEQSIEKLTQLDQEYRTGLASCGKNVVLVNHDAFAYLARDYGFTSIAISGLSPESEPTPQQIKKLIDEAREHDLKYIFYEELVDPRISETIASEVGAQILELSPIGNEEEDYFTLMRKNLGNLKIALECS